MRFYAPVLALGAAASLVAAQATPPACFLSCYQSVGASSSCGLTEVACLCADQAFIGGVTSCLQSTCTSASDFAAGGTYAVQTCSAAGVTVDTSALATATAAGSSASASGSATSSIASALSSVASGASASASSASSALSSLSSQLSSVASSATGSAPSATASGDSDASTLKKGGALAGIAALAAVFAL